MTPTDKIISDIEKVINMTPLEKVVDAMERILCSDRDMLRTTKSKIIIIAGNPDACPKDRYDMEAYKEKLENEIDRIERYIHMLKQIGL